MKNIAIIPARGGSKRIPRKNIKPFLGKSIIAYSIEAALQTELFDTVMVSTDDDEIAMIAKQYGATVPFMRSKETANDYATLADVLLEVIAGYANDGIHPENVCCILPTAPFVTSHDIAQAYELLNTGKYNSIFPIVAFSYPILRSMKMDKDGFIAMNWPQYFSSRSQDLETAYHDAGSFHWVKTDALIEQKSSITTRTGGIIVDEITAQDIDTEADWKLAEMKFQLLTQMEILTTNNKQQTTNNKQQTTNNKQQTTNNKQQTTNNKQQTTNNKQQTTLSPLPRQSERK
ncbi:N-acetylneuraminate cytidylyltransferase [Candidatus Symbiothrix dinenymphae]|nr:N-acetylneuraminate cytidylyltransferase [Candidatus Symbiothrix dinenymphae]